MRARAAVSVAVILALAAAVLATSPSASAHGTPECPAAPFPDVSTHNPFCPEIIWMVDEDITHAYPDGTFRPGAKVDRQTIAAFLHRLGGAPPGPFPDPGYSDVPTTHPFYTEIAWLADNEITGGYPDGTFRPSVKVDRQTIAALLHRLEGRPHGPFPDPGYSDVPTTHPFYTEIAWLADKEITGGYPDGTFRPSVKGDRQTTAALLFRFTEATVGFVDATWWHDRQDGYLEFATGQYEPNSILNLIAHLERAERDPAFSFDATTVGPDAFANSWNKIDGYLDTADFDLLYLINLWYGYADELGPALRDRIESALLDFKYWYTDPSPPGVIDERWYWSENHRIIFHALEYLAGQAFPNEVFTITGMTGAQHRDRAAAQIDEWLAEKSDLGFSEWHSDVYYQKDVTPLLTLVEFADDPVLAERSAMILDLVLFDLATHTRDGNNGATHGRSYMKDKSIAPDQDVFGAVKILFDDTGEPYRSRGEAGSTLLARASEFRLPEVLRLAAVSNSPMIDRERMGVPIGIDAPLTTTPVAPYGKDFDDPDNIPFWWERGALTAWPVVPQTLKTADDYNLWETEAFSAFSDLHDIVGTNYELGRTLAHALRKIINVGLLDEVNTYTYRTGDVMLSSVQDYRPGEGGDQYHAWQATLGARASVFTTHPGNEPRPGTSWVDGDRYWTGTGTMPRTAQQGRAAIHLYAPAYANPAGDPLLGAFGFLEYTHAWFPTENFDEVASSGNWTFGHKDGGYVALWSWRTPEWRVHDPNVTFTNGLTQPFDLIAPGGPDNVWIVEVADATDWGGDFAAFQTAMTAAPPTVIETAPTADLAYGGFTVSWASPTEGLLEFGSTTPLMVGGTPTAIDGYPRYDNPWTQTPFGSDQVALAEGERSLLLDFATWTRTAG